MYRLQEELKDDNDILFLSHTVIPDVDTVEQLKKYAIENNVDDAKWNLVTGEKKQIYEEKRFYYTWIYFGFFSSCNYIVLHDFKTC